jgi:hypothetical protein
MLEVLVTNVHKINLSYQFPISCHDLMQNTEGMEFTPYSYQYIQQSWLLMWYLNTAVELLGMIQILIQNHFHNYMNKF